MYFAGIDAGQSSTTAAIAGEDGRELGRGYAGPADEIGATASSTRLRDALENALAAALRDARLPLDTQFSAVVAGISGYEGRVYGQAPQLASQRTILVHDTVIAHAGALGGAPGIVVIAGTGSVAYVRFADGTTHLEGGWGYLFGDEGSGFWIAREAVRAAAAHGDCEGTRALLSFFDVHTLRELVRAFYVGQVSRASLASFAPVCIEAAKIDAGCPCLCEPPRRAARELAALAVRAACGRPDPIEVAFTGGLIADGWLRGRTVASLRELLPAAVAVEARDEPVGGALLLARRA
ncbi:MAG TPA: BadF/BadG/BcrA/BcrD ATPase family protein [Candidatus Aquilonibacter sp.]|nr:BadF/BadG/BcrA/BcrD ATPase family protein [Candidatus Aquilonibacter sp.]